MRHNIVTFIVICVAATAMLGASVADAGWVLTDSNGDETVISQGKMKTVWENGSVIFDASTSEVHFIDDRRKIIASGTLDELCEGVAQMMESMMASIPEEQREMMKQMMGGSAGETAVAEKGPGGKIAGFETTRYEVSLDGELYEELWLTKSESLKKECQGLMQMLMKFSSCLSSVSPMEQPSPESSPGYMKLFETAVLVRSVQHGGEDEADNTTVISARDVPASAFSLPAGYEEAPLSEIWAGTP